VTNPVVPAPLNNDYDFPSRLSAASDGSPQALRWYQNSPGQTVEQQGEQLLVDANGTETGDENPASLRDKVSENLPLERHASRVGEWSMDYSLDGRPGYSSQLIGLSNETDPFLLRHYQYDTRDTFQMIGLDFRKVTDDINMQGPTISSQSSQIPVSDMPVQFAMTNEEICEEDVKIIDKDFSGSNTEAEDHALLYQIVPIDFGSRLLKL
jgi:hypothetical protein